MGRIGRGLRLIRTSWEILKKDKEIMLFPLISIIISGFIIVSFIAPLYYFTGLDFSTDIFDGYMIYVYMFALYIPLYFVGTFFNTAVVGCANLRIEGNDPTIKDGLRIAGKNWYKILLWALLAGTVGVVLQILRNKLSFIGKIVVFFIGIAWTYGTFFIVPVLIFEDEGVLDSVKNSASLFKDTWGETITGSIGFGIIIAILLFGGMIPLAFLTVLGVLSWLTAIVVGAVYFVLLFAFNSALNGIFVTALYHYAKDGKLPGPYTKDMIPSPVGHSVYDSGKGSGGYKTKSASDSFYNKFG